MGDYQFDAILELLCEAEDLCDAGDHEDAIRICNEVEMVCRGEADPNVAEVIAETLLCRANALAGLERFEEERLVYAEIARRFESDDSPELTHLVARARLNAAVASVCIGRDDEALFAYAKFIGHYRTSRSPEIQEQVARAMLNRAIILKHAPHSDDAYPQFEELVALFGSSEDSEIRATVAFALASKAELELRSRRPAEAIESASRGLALCSTECLLERFHCHLVRWGAYMISKDTVSGEREVVRILDMLPEITDPSCVERFGFMLHGMAEVLGRGHATKLTQKSRSARILAPLADTLKREIDRESETLQDIEEVAAALRVDFANLNRS